MMSELFCPGLHWITGRLPFPVPLQQQQQARKQTKTFTWQLADLPWWRLWPGKGDLLQKNLLLAQQQASIGTKGSLALILQWPSWGWMLWALPGDYMAYAF